ncbi:MAG: hypothetical protein MZV70_57775 [Desulfobacterales bacterium]|nr:hypothetical protein [Desulfobacterales bacterium]
MFLSDVPVVTLSIDPCISCTNDDDFVRNPISALRSLRARCGVPGVRRARRKLARLELGLLAKSSNEALRMFKMTPNIVRNLVVKKSTRMYPAEVREPFAKVRGELINDIERCIFCGTCEVKCPSQCIAGGQEGLHLDLRPLRLRVLRGVRGHLPGQEPLPENPIPEPRRPRGSSSASKASRGKKTRPKTRPRRGTHRRNSAKNRRAEIRREGIERGKPAAPRYVQ